MIIRNMSLNEPFKRMGIRIVNPSILKTGKAKTLKLSTPDNLCKILEYKRKGKKEDSRKNE